MKKYEEITRRIKDANKRYWAGDNISEFIYEGEKQQLIDEATEAFDVSKEEKKVRVSLEKMLGLSLGASLQKEQDTLLHNALVATNYLPRNYFERIRGGDYPETIMLKDKRLPDNKKGLRVGLAQELKHQQLIKLQYDK